MANPEGGVSRSRTEGINRFLDRYDGLRQTLHAWVDILGQEKAPLSFEQVVELAAADREARLAVRQYFGSYGEGYESENELANDAREKLAWALVEALDSQSGKSVRPD
jgi:hypothetical protein